MKTGYLLVILIIIFIFLISACGGNSTQTIPSETPDITSTAKTIEPTQTGEPGFTPTIEAESTLEPSPDSVIAGDTPILTYTPEAYPQPLGNTPTPGNLSEPYPQPLGITPMPGNLQEPYPGPGVPQQGYTEQAAMDTAYPPPGGNDSPNPTQPIAINPIQSPIPTLGATVNATNRVTSTTIVRTGLKASDPGKVKLASGKHQLVEIFAFWCPICKSMAPVMNGLEGKYQGRLTFSYLDIDNPANKSFKNALGYKYQPHFFLLDGDGKILHQWVGFVPVEDFEAVLTPLFP